MKKLIILYIYFFCCAINAQDIDYLSNAEKFIYTNIDSAHFYLEKSFQKSIQAKNWENTLETLSYFNFASSYHHNLDLFSKSIKRQDSLFKIIDLNSIENKFYYSIGYSYDHGLYFYNLRDYDRALQHFFKVVERFDKEMDPLKLKENSAYLSSTYAYIATIYKSELKFNISEEFYNEAMRIVTLYEDSYDQQLDYKNLVASIKADQKDFEGSNKQAKISVGYYLDKNPSKNLNALISTSLLIISNYIDLNKPDSAALYINTIKPFLEQRPRFINSFKKREAQLALIKTDTTKAVNIYKTIVANLENKPHNYKELASVFNELGNVYSSQKQLDSAAKAFKKGLALFSKIKPTKKPLQTLELIKSYGTFLNNKGKITDYKTVINLVDEALIIINGAKESIYDDSDKQILTENVFPILENGISACYNLFLGKKDNQYIETAFSYFEKSKSPVLLEALQTKSANKFSNISDELLEKEKLLKIKISGLQKSTILQNDSISERELFQLRREHETLISEMEKKHPNYFQLKYEQNIINFHDLQESIVADANILSFFYGTNAIYSITISPSRLEFSKISDFKDIRIRLASVQKNLAKHSDFDKELKNDLAVLYDLLIPKSIQNGTTNNLTIIPDGTLRRIPFEALITDVNKPSFLIEKLNINYQNSATVAMHLNSNGNGSKNLLAMAPVFDNDAENFKPLPNAAKEVASILNFFEGKQLKGEAASLQNFKMYSNDYSVIHLATHAKLNDEFPEYSYMAFSSNQTDEIEFLYQNDIYNLDLDADMVTLSACETGVGELKKGEGLMSLSRAFFYSGAKSLVTSLWKIDDRASSEIMIGFYENLSKGDSKSKSARHAKLKFIDNNRDNPLIHPYYWAGLVVYGNTQPLVDNNRIFIYVLVLLGALTFVLIIMDKKLI